MLTGWVATILGLLVGGSAFGFYYLWKGTPWQKEWYPTIAKAYFLVGPGLVTISDGQVGFGLVLLPTLGGFAVMDSLFKK